MEFHNLTTGHKLLRVVKASLTVLSLFALLVFITLSAISLATWSVPRFWNLCFLLCAVSLGGWMLLYTGLLRIGGALFYPRKYVLLLYSLILAVLISTVVNFAGHQRYVAILALVLALAAFHLAVPGITNPNLLLRLLKNERIARDSPKSFHEKAG
jgi:hypothetical protein